MPAQPDQPVVRTRRDPRAFAHRFLRRHRRPLAAATAGLGVLLALTTLRGASAPAASSPSPNDGPGLRAGEVIVPVLLTSGAIAGVLLEGDIVDIVGFPDGQATVVAPRSASSDYRLPAPPFPPRPPPCCSWPHLSPAPWP